MRIRDVMCNVSDRFETVLTCSCLTHSPKVYYKESHCAQEAYICRRSDLPSTMTMAMTRSLKVRDIWPCGHEKSGQVLSAVGPEKPHDTERRQYIEICAIVTRDVTIDVVYLETILQSLITCSAYCLAFFFHW